MATSLPASAGWAPIIAPPGGVPIAFEPTRIASDDPIASGSGAALHLHLPGALHRRRVRLRRQTAPFRSRRRLMPRRSRRSAHRLGLVTAGQIRQPLHARPRRRQRHGLAELGRQGVPGRRRPELPRPAPAGKRGRRRFGLLQSVVTSISSADFGSAAVGRGSFRRSAFAADDHRSPRRSTISRWPGCGSASPARMPIRCESSSASSHVQTTAALTYHLDMGGDAGRRLSADRRRRIRSPCPAPNGASDLAFPFSDVRARLRPRRRSIPNVKPVVPRPPDSGYSAPGRQTTCRS